MDPSYNGNFGSFGNGGVTPQQPVVPGGGMPSGNVAPVPSNIQQDIILSPSPEKKSKKWLVWVILALVGVGIVVGIVVFGFSGANKGFSSRTLFNKYSNYLLFGKDDDGPIQVDNINSVYSLDCDDKTFDECQDFFKGAKALLDGFADSNYADGLKDVFVDDIKYYLQNFADYYVYVTVGYLEDDAIFEYYVNHGYDATVEYINSFYDDFEKNENDAMVAYGNFQISSAMVKLDIAKEYDEWGCFKDGSYNQECVMGVTLSESLINRLLKLDDEVSIQRMFTQKRNELVHGTVYLSRLFNLEEEDE